VAHRQAQGPKQKWVGYETTQAETDVLRFRQASDVVEVVLRENPFYAESGGQVSDTGRVKGEGWTLDVEGVEKLDGVSAVVGHFADEFEPTPVVAQVDEPRRKNIERNHTATHLVHAALRKILAPTCASKARSWPPSGCASTSRTTGPWTTRHSPGSRRK